jgi:hypothetical protein
LSDGRPVVVARGTVENGDLSQLVVRKRAGESQGQHYPYRPFDVIAEIVEQA